MSYLPCKNPHCRSVGRSHPNCKCYEDWSEDKRAGLEAKGAQFPGTTKGMHLRGSRGGSLHEARKRGRHLYYRPMAEGGVVSEEELYCDGPHKPDCEHYMAHGGVVPPKAYLEIKDDPSDVLGHAAIDNGLLGILNHVGKPKMVEPQQHAKVLHEARAQHEWRREPKDLNLPKTHGHKLGDHIADQNHDGMADHMHGHPLVGGAGKGHLKPIMALLSQPLMEKEPHPEAFRGAADYLSHAAKGHERLDSYMKTVIGDGKSPKLAPDKSRDALKKELEDLESNTDALMSVGGSLGHYLPDHGAEIGVLTASALNYLQSLKPQQSQPSPLDRMSHPDPSAEAKYNRQLDIAQQPLLAMQNLKNGTLLPDDIATVKTIYPGLFKSMTDKASEQMIDYKSKGKDIPYHQRISLSLLLGQPLDSTLTPQGMQAIMNSSKGQQAQQQAEKAKGPSKASGAELSQINKVNSMFKTPLQDREMDRNK